CIFKDTEIENGAPTREFTYVKGIMHQFVFNTERLNKNKSKIADLINMLPISCIPQSFLCLCNDKNNRLWTGDHATMEILMVLGIACGLIEYTYPQEKWASLPGSVPLVNKTEKKLDEVIVGEKPEEFSKYVAESEKKKQEEEKETLDKIRALAKERFEEQYEKAAPVLEMLGYSMGIEDENYYLYDNKGEKLCELSVTPILGGFSYEGVVNDTSVEYTYSCDGKNSDGGLVYRNIVTIDNIKKSDEAYSGKLVKFELGIGLHEVSNVPRIEVTIIEPDSSDEKTIKYFATPYDLNLEIENNFGAFGNKENGTDRTVHYRNTTTNPFVNQGSLLLHEDQQNGDSYNISIERTNAHPEFPAKYAHSKAYYKVGNKTNPDVIKHSFDGQESANLLACEYLKTSRVSNLYNHITTRIESEANGMMDYIHQKYPFIKAFENIMAQEPNSEVEELVNSFAIEGADLKCEKAHRTLKELKNKQQ
ncbi:MAG: hypothetical protein K2I70_00910, partial [Bacilli bacterium]|nr:hypothetical protein [Bacilli bacterium]